MHGNDRLHNTKIEPDQRENRLRKKKKKEATKVILNEASRDVHSRHGNRHESHARDRRRRPIGSSISARNRIKVKDERPSVEKKRKEMKKDEKKGLCLWWRDGEGVY